MYNYILSAGVYENVEKIYLTNNVEYTKDGFEELVNNIVKDIIKKEGIFRSYDIDYVITPLLDLYGFKQLHITGYKHICDYSLPAPNRRVLK